MTDYVYIEAAHEHRRDFARWCLAQNPPIQTASATGSDVPVRLYPSVPAELLEGAYVDGYLYGRTTTATEPPKTVDDPVEAVEDTVEAVETKPAPSRRKTRG